jgi:CRISPR-associated RAMP protein (TIGR02581 family)
MLRQLINHASLDLELSPSTPVLICAGTEGLVKMPSVTMMIDGHPTPYVPGSSLKGAMRSHAEALLRTLAPTGACDPFEDDHAAPLVSCNEQFKIWLKAQGKEVQAVPSNRAYAKACLACRLFGSLHFRGRWNISDALPSGNVTMTRRDGVGIDRFSGGSSGGALYDLEAIAPAKSNVFRTRIDVQNFELWQLGLTLLVVRDLCSGDLPVGHNKSRGMGRFNGKMARFEVRLVAKHAKRDGKLRLVGAGEVLGKDNAWGLSFPDAIATLPGGVAVTEDPLFVRLDLAPHLAEMERVLRERLVGRLDNYKRPDAAS